jgi:hypothetical protein
MRRRMICGERAIRVWTTLAKIRPERALRGSRYRSGTRTITLGDQEDLGPFRTQEFGRPESEVTPTSDARPTNE